MGTREHEREVCDAVIRLMESRRGEPLFKVGVPEEEEHQRKAVDLRVRGMSSEFVLEHTRVESLPRQIADDHRFQKLLGPLEASLTGRLPTPGHYVLVVASGAVEGAKDGERIRDALAAWVCKKAPALQVGSPSTAPNHYVREVPAGVPFEVTLYRWPGLQGKFMVARSVPNHLEDKRRVRIRRALEAKCPKLHTARGDGQTSVLVFESNDLALANHAVIAEIVVKELSRRDDIPDEVYLVETEIKPRVVWVFKEGPHLFPDIPDAGPHYVGSHAE